MTPRIGLIGVGLMGQGIAHNLVHKGFPLWLLEHPGNQPLGELLAAGARTCTTPQDLAAHCDVVLIVVTGAPEVEAVLTQPQGLLAGLRAGHIVVDCSTSLPETTERLGALIQERGAMLIDAPMTRLAKDAREGRLNLLVGGAAAVLETVRPVLAAFAENITHVGRLGDGHRMKLLHNFVSVGTMTLIAEAAAHARRSGVDLTVFEQVLATGGGAGAALQRLKPALLENRTDSVPFALSNAYKDLSYYLTMAQSIHAHDRVAQGITDTLQAQTQAGHGQDFVPALIKLLGQT